MIRIIIQVLRSWRQEHPYNLVTRHLSLLDMFQTSKKACLKRQCKWWQKNNTRADLWPPMHMCLHTRMCRLSFILTSSYVWTSVLITPITISYPHYQNNLSFTFTYSQSLNSAYKRKTWDAVCSKSWTLDLSTDFWAAVELSMVLRNSTEGEGRVSLWRALNLLTRLSGCWLTSKGCSCVYVKDVVPPVGDSES